MKDEIIEERIKENKELFAEKELKYMSDNFDLVKKIYLLGLINGREIYGKNLQ